MISGACSSTIASSFAFTSRSTELRGFAEPPKASRTDALAAERFSGTDPMAVAMRLTAISLERVLQNASNPECA